METNIVMRRQHTRKRVHMYAYLHESQHGGLVNCTQCESGRRDRRDALEKES
jgi:hypothetical protein